MGSYAGPISLLPLDPMGSYAGPISLLPLDPRLHKPRVSSWGPEPKTPLAVTSSLRIRFLSASPRPTTSRTASVPSSTLSHGAHVLEKEHLEKRPPPGASPAAGASVSCTRLGMPQLTHYFPRETARPPGDLWQRLQTFLVIPSGEQMLLLGQARGAVTHPAMCKTVPSTESHPDPKVNSTDVENTLADTWNLSKWYK